jgi:DNA-binding transcriptional ArsR family regulator
MPADRLSLTFSALAHPTRRAMLARLSQGDASVQELAKPFKMSLPAVSKHLKLLERSGLISRSKVAQWRPCRLEAKPMQEASHWMETYRKEWEEHFDRLDSYLQELQKNAKKGAPRRKNGGNHAGE